mgnify:CR=1 FL=1
MSSPIAHPRRSPRQERSRLMVSRILDAGRTVLIKHGYDGTTTNLIAKEADISPGSLYQYFPNKDVIIAAIVDDYTDQIARTVTTHLVEHVGKPAERDTMRETLAVLLDAMSEQPELLRAMIEPRDSSSATKPLRNVTDWNQNSALQLGIAHWRWRRAA